MKEQILEILHGLVAIDSFSATNKEQSAADYVVNFLSGIDYFKEHTNHCGHYPIPDDQLNRTIAYGLVRGNSPKTVVLMGHYDIVGIEDYGHMKPYAFDIDKLPEVLRTAVINSDAMADLESGEWLFGRGTADMKGGLSVYLSILAEYSKNPDSGSLLFISVPDEESYSAGMRAAAGFLKEMRDSHELDYRLLLCSESCGRKNGSHVMPVGTGGKMLACVLTQGVKAHISKCFNGLNPISLLAEIYLDTELSLDFSDEYMGELSMPPTWNYFKDSKLAYDVSIPLRASGYMSVLGTQTPDEVLAKLKSKSMAAFARYLDKMKAIHKEYKSRSKFDNEHEITYKPYVLTFAELNEYCHSIDPEGFKKFCDSAYAETEARIRSNTINYPQGTLDLMSKVLDFSQIAEPVVIIGFGPPYYPAMSNRKLKDFPGKLTEYFDLLRSQSLSRFGVDIVPQEYDIGLSDCSYSAIDKVFDFDSFSSNNPLWGKLYAIDFEAIRDITMPSLLLGPWGKAIHQETERVHKQDLTERLPALSRAIINHIWEE